MRVRIPGMRRVRQTARLLRSRFVSHGLVLGYHRVSDHAADPFDLSVTRENFTAHLEVLRRIGRPRPLAELAAGAAEGDVPSGVIAVTFDDGYSDALSIVKPLLERYDVPATVFVVAGNLGGEFWWDALDRLASGAGAADSATVPGWFATEVETRALAGRSWSRSASCQELHRELSGLGSTARQRALERLESGGGTAVVASPVHRSLRPTELRRLAHGGLVDIGAHTLTHPRLDALAAHEVREEILGSKRRLEDLLGRSIESFSYPHGCSTLAAVSAVRSAGFRYACGSRPDVVWSGSNAFELPRLWVPDCDGPAFERWLRRWLAQ